MNDEILEYIRQHLLNKYNINDNVLICNCYSYINKLLGTELIKNRNNIIRIKKQVEELEFDIKHLRNGTMNKENYDSVGEGKNTGGSENKVEVAYLEICNIKEEINVLIAKKRALSKSYELHYDKIRKFLELLKNDTHALVMELTLFYGMKSADIIDQYLPYYSVVYVRKMRNIAKRHLADILSDYIRRTQKNEKK